MSFLGLVKTRRSVRRYSGRSVPRDIIARCLEAARLAPSACNSQPWKFIVVDDPALKEKLCEAAFSGPYAMNSFVKAAPVLVAVARMRSSASATVGGFLRRIQFNLMDIGIACEHFILQAAEDGVGTCWIGWFNGAKARKVLGLGQGAKVDIIISMGYPEGQGPSEKTRKSFEEVAQYNRGE